MKNKIITILLILLCMLLSANLLFISYNSQKLESTRIKQLESIRDDYLNYREIFEQTFVLFKYGEYKKITSDNYDTKNEALYFIFEDLEYTEVYSDFAGNIYFNKFSEGLTFDGLVYQQNGHGVANIIKTTTIVLDNEGKWLAHHALGF